jgi:hypothetical protein
LGENNGYKRTGYTIAKTRRKNKRYREVSLTFLAKKKELEN